MLEKCKSEEVGKVLFGGEEHMVVWSGHAIERVRERNKEFSLSLANSIMQLSMNEVERKMGERLKGLHGAIAFLDKKLDLFFVLYVENPQKKVIVQTFSDSSLYPRVGDLTVFTTQNGNIYLQEWEDRRARTFGEGDGCIVQVKNESYLVLWQNPRKNLRYCENEEERHRANNQISEMISSALPSVNDIPQNTNLFLCDYGSNKLVVFSIYEDRIYVKSFSELYINRYKQRETVILDSTKCNLSY